MITEKSSIENFNLQGLHRPFNKSLKSLSWVCTYAHKLKFKKTNNFYYRFYISILKDIIRHEQQENPWPEGCISVDDAKAILKNHRPSKEFELKIRQVLLQRDSADDRLVYKTYKNVSYYIALAKKLNLIDKDYRLTKVGQSLAQASHRFYSFSQTEKEIILTLLLETNADLIISMAIMNNDIERKKLSDAHALLFLKNTNIFNVGNVYVRSFRSNYMSVLQYWMKQLDIVSNHGKIKAAWLGFFNNHPTWHSIYKCQTISFLSFQKEILATEVKKREKYKKLLQCYQKIVLAGNVDLGYINLYDLKDGMHMGFERFNKFMNEFFIDNKTNLIILFNNTVSSIDRRRRFLINEKYVLKIKIIQKRTYGI